jgi:hypothetical protein
MIVPGGCLSPDRERWVAAKPNFVALSPHMPTLGFEYQISSYVRVRQFAAPQWESTGDGR